MDTHKPEVIIAINDDGPECKPTTAKKKNNMKKKTKRKVEKTINTSSKTETLVVTQIVRERTFKCIINLTNICEHREKPKHKHKPRTDRIDKVNAKQTKKKKVDEIVPTCKRHRCQIDMKRKNDICFERKHKKELDRKKLDKSCSKAKSESFETKQSSDSCKKKDKINTSTNYKVIRDKRGHRKSHRQGRGEPRQGRSRSHTRYLSPISPGSLSEALSECNGDLIMSYEDISSDSTIEIDTLIKRTKDREKKSSIDGYYLQSKASLHDNFDIPSVKVTKKHDIRFEKAEPEFNISNRRNKHKPKYDYVENVANIPLPDTNKPSRIFEQIIDHKYEPILTSTPKYEDNTETLDASPTDDGTVLTGEMDIVSFHSQGTLVLDYLYSPSHLNESPSLTCDVYSPTMSPDFYNNEGVPESLHRVLMSTAPTPLIPNYFQIASLKRDELSPCGSPLTPFSVAHDNENCLDKLESKVKQEQHVKSIKVKLERISPETDIIEGSTANITSINFDIDNVKVEERDVPEQMFKNDPFGSMKSCVNIKEEINEDSINNNQPYKRLDLSTRFIINEEDDNLRIKKED